MLVEGESYEMHTVKIKNKFYDDTNER